MFRVLPFLFLLLSLLVSSCEEIEVLTPAPTETSYYFPPIDSSAWETLSSEGAGWQTHHLQDLLDYLASNNTRAFLLLKDGKIVIEQYWGKDILNRSEFTQDTPWYWASAGKTLTAFLVGLAQQDGLLKINDPTSQYLGSGWTTMPIEQENQIQIQHQLTMTTGLAYNIADLDCTDPTCLTYKAAPGTQWFYHNAPYTLLGRVLTKATGEDLNTYTDSKLRQTIGMKGFWRKGEFNNVYWSTARDAARFGSLILNNGKWGNQQLMQDTTYFQAMVNSSQSLNPSYGYLWWLNGKGRVIFPASPIAFNTDIAPNALADLFAAMGKNGQFIDVVPSQNLVVVRMGEAPSDALVPVQFHDEMWAKIMALIWE